MSAAPASGERSPLDLDPEAMRRMGYAVVDVLVRRLATLDEQPALRTASRAEMEARLRQGPPDSPQPFEAILDQLVGDILEFAGRIDHPRFVAFVPTSPTWPSILADFLAAGFNIFQGTWLASAGPSEVELIVLDWFREWLGLPPGASGLLLSGGSAANLTALVVARHARLGGPDPDAVIYASDQVHSSMERAAAVLGFARERVRLLPTDESFRLRPESLAAAVEADAAAGLRPFFVVANAGATSTGAIDPLGRVADVCAGRGLWLHVDAAYGGFAVLTERGRAWLDGIGRADSVTLDPHKWLFQSYEAGCLLVREGRLLREAFRVMPHYLQDTAVAGEAAEVNFGERGIQLSRMARALKVWVSLKHFGVPAFRQAIDTGLDLALEAEQRIRASPELELLSPAMLGVVAFRRHPRGMDDEARLERVNAALLRRVVDSGLAMVSSTRIRGAYALRLCIMNFRTRADDVHRILDAFEHSPAEA
ncbi:MAG TPA: aminotransferase class I/II-fold pyridoxal phosphate-dependent enzyme [Longimicrobiales bacterium]|nr:aminotransferase class I/II-fold pyridoxal phosphate-dependent enzyme [Longimicrobiales bacterium]